MSPRSNTLRRRWFTAAVLAAAACTAAVVVYAASFITPLSLPTWNDGANTYSISVCSNTNLSDNICMEYDVNLSNNFTSLSCSFTSFNDCTGIGGTGSTWTCTVPEIANATPLRFQFFRADAGGCSSNRSLFTGFLTFNTGPNAVTLASFSAEPARSPSANLMLAVVAGLAGLADVALLWRWLAAQPR